MIMNLIILSRVLYFPIIKSNEQKIVINTVHTSIENNPPLMDFAIPAVTIVTAVWIENIVAIVRKK